VSYIKKHNLCLPTNYGINSIGLSQDKCVLAWDRAFFVLIDGAFIDTCLSMQWANYKKKCQRSNVHLGTDN
jgi:hypothetical protein